MTGIDIILRFDKFIKLSSVQQSNPSLLDYRINSMHSNRKYLMLIDEC